MKTSTTTPHHHTGESSRQDIYTRVTERIIADLERGVRTWVQPWSAEHAAGKITRPLRHNGTPYSGINILMLWSSAVSAGFTAPIWMTYRQSVELGGHVRKGEKGSPVVYANSITRTETDDATGDETEREIHYMKCYTVFNAEQIEGLPAHYYAKPEPGSPGSLVRVRVVLGPKHLSPTEAMGSILRGPSQGSQRPRGRKAVRLARTQPPTP